MIIQYPDYISKKEVFEIQNTINPFVGKNKQKFSQNRDGTTVNISTLPELTELDKKINNIFSDFQNQVIKHRYKPLSVNSGDTGYEYHLYNPNEMCHYHADGELASHGDVSLLRYATVILFLTDNEEGSLVFPSQNIEVKPEAGKIIAFPPYGMFSHYSKPDNKPREIIMTWFVYTDFLIHKNAT